MEVEINWLGVLLAAVAGIAVSSVWYARSVFGTYWMKLSKVDEKHWENIGWTPMVYTFLLMIVMAYVLAHVTYLSVNFFTDYTYMSAAFSSGFWMWLGFVVPTLFSNGMFELRRKKLMGLNAANWLVTLLVMGWVLGLVGI